MNFYIISRGEYADTVQIGIADSMERAKSLVCAAGFDLDDDGDDAIRIDGPFTLNSIDSKHHRTAPVSPNWCTAPSGTLLSSHMPVEGTCMVCGSAGRQGSAS